MIKCQTFDNSRLRLFKDRDFHDKQLQFFDFALDKINTDRNTNQITVFPARCGLGKTTFLKILIDAWLQDNPGRGLIVITDNLTRLNQLNDEDDSRIAYLTATNKSSEIKRQGYCPILLISTQRYFQMDSIEPFLTYKIGEDQYERDTVIFDETPYFFEDSEIGIDEINYFHSALHGGIPDSSDKNDKKWILKEYDKFRKMMIESLCSLEQQRNQTTYIYQTPIYSFITNDDDRFKKIVENNPDIYNKYPGAKRILSDLFYFVKNGGFFTSYKLRDNLNYHKSYIIRKSHIEKFWLNKGVKTFVFDASAAISKLYPCYLEWLNVLDCGAFNVSLDWLTLNIINVNTSRNSIVNKVDRDIRLNAIKHYIEGLDTNDALFVTYKTLVEKGEFDDIGFSGSNAMYFGNVKGFNQHKDATSFIQVGTNRQSSIVYLLNCMFFMDDIRRLILETSDDININMATIDNLLGSALVDDYMNAEIVADILQNLFRTKARNISNEENISAYIFTMPSPNFNKYIDKVFTQYGAKINVIELEELKIAKIANRKGDTKAKKILNWLDAISVGKAFDIKEMFADLKIDNAQFKGVKRSNKVIKRIFDEMKIEGKRGLYMKK